MQAQGGPSRAELWDKGQQSTPESHLWLKTPQTGSRPPKQNQKATPMQFMVGSMFPFEIEIWFNVFSRCISGLKVEDEAILTASGKGSQLLKCIL